MKFPGHILELHSFSSLSLSFPVTYTRAYTHSPFLLLFSVLLPLPFLPLCECSLTHTAVGCVGGHYMPLLLSLSLSFPRALPHHLILFPSLSPAVTFQLSKAGFNFLSPRVQEGRETKRGEALEKPYSLWMRGSKKEETLHSPFGLKRRKSF